MTEDAPLQKPPPREARSQKTRRRTRRRAYVNIPGLARRGRSTLRQVIALLFGGFVSSVEVSRRRGGRGILFRLRAMAAWVVRLFLNKEIASQPFPVQLRMRLEILGPTYVKLGQILSLRQDVLPDIVTSELRNLLSDLPPVSYEEIRTVVESDLGRPVEEIFAEVDPVPLGSASIAQSHWARLASGDQVILKVVKPNIRDLLYRDATLLRTTARFLQLIIPRYQPRRIIDEFCDYTLREVEMKLEAENAETFADNFSDMPDVVFPRIHHEFSANNVLCMEYLAGDRPDAGSVTSLPLADRQRLIDLGAEAIIRMLYQDGFFHADLHPANLLVLPDVKVGFLDLGMVGHLDPELRHSLLELFYAMVMEDFEGAARHLAAVSQTESRSDVPGFRRAVKEVARRWRRQPRFEDFSLALLILECIQLGARYHLYFPVEMVLMVKALVTYEGVGYMLDPDFSVAEVSEHHIRHIFRQEYSPAKLVREGLRVAPEIFDAALKLPLLVSEGLSTMEERTRRRPQRPLTGVRATLFGGACMIAGAILIGLDGPLILAVLLFTAGVLLPLRRGE
ncbi:MAG: AarF/ABC1/UbiB kinase family protein [Acidobacteria bacterium]|jgi:ubiquinone biosynthesis protein|nr:AarF/ABC1/UbiB kinase family protein [Acidobacteriota bacterium]